MEKIARIFAQLIRILCIAAAGYLFLQGLFTICTIQRVTERTFYVDNNPLYAVVGIGIAVILLGLVWRYGGKFCRKYEGFLVGAGVVVSAGFLLWWMSQTQFWYWGDEEKIFQYAQMFRVGDYSGWKPGGYPYMWPHQNGMILFVALLLQFFELSQVYVVFRVINIVFYELTMLFLWQTLRKLFPDARIAVVQMAMLFLFFPYGFYCVMFYGNVIGLGFGVMAIWCAVTYGENEKLSYLAGCAVAMICSIIFKQNDAILFIGILLLLLLQPLPKEGFEGKLYPVRARKRMLKRLCRVSALALVVCLGIQLPNWIVELRSGMDLSGAGNSKWAHVAMGLQDSEDAPGWYNTYNERLFAECGYDKAATGEAAKVNLKQTLEYYGANPMEGWAFFHRKMASQWNNPTFEGFHMQNARNTSEELSPFVKSVINDGGKANILLTLFLDVYESVILFGVLVYLLTQRGSIKELLFGMLFVGAFVFFAVWEAKGRYVAPFYLMLIPYGAVGYYKLYEGGRRFDVTKKAVLAIAAVVLVAALCNVPLLNHSLKLGTQSEEYYQYIHEFNDNFEGLRF